MNQNRRVVITGLGVISPVGIGAEEAWENLLAGKSGIGPITHFDTTDTACKIAGEVKDFDPERYMDRKEARRMDRFAQFAVAAGKLALEDSGLDLTQENAERIGVILGTGIGGIATFEQQCQNLLEKGPRRVSPFTVPMMIVNMAAGQIAIQLNAKGPNLTVVSACASGTNAIGEAYKNILRGAAEVMYTGGTEAAITPLAFASFSAAKTLSTHNEEPERASRPFDLDRDGFVMGEGATVLVLEELEHALNRGANIYAEVAGYGFMADAYHITSPAADGIGARNAMQTALEDAGISADQIDYINAHGTSTHLNDQIETLSIKAVFGEAAPKVAISSTKSMTGHLLGAAGALEGAVIALAIRDSVVPPTINYETVDPECDLDYVPNMKREMPVRYAMSNSLGFGGQNASIIFKKYE